MERFCVRVFTGRLVVKRRLADAALMEMRLNERKQQNEHNQKKGIVNREIIPQTRRNMYPKQCFWVHIAETCTRKGGFGYMWEWQGLMDSNHRMTESESVALPLGEAPIWQELMESNHRLQIWSLLFSSLN